MNPCTFQRIADLDNLVIQTPANRRAIVLLHGYGANFSDLTGLATVVDPRSSWDWYFPNGPQEISFAPQYAGRAWFPIDMEKLQLALMRGDRQPFKNEIPLGFDTASMGLEKLVKELSDRYDEIVVGGFSQGSMVAADFALHTEQKIKALLLLSSTLIASPRWKSAIAKKPAQSFRVFQSHGQFDNVLPFEAAEELKGFWNEHKYGHEHHGFAGGHEIPFPVLEKLKSFLSSL